MVTVLTLSHLNIVFVYILYQVLIMFVFIQEGQCIDPISTVNETNASAEKPVTNLLTIVNQIQDRQHEQNNQRSITNS